MKVDRYSKKNKNARNITLKILYHRNTTEPY